MTTVKLLWRRIKKRSNSKRLLSLRKNVSSFCNSDLFIFTRDPQIKKMCFLKSAGEDSQLCVKTVGLLRACNNSEQRPGEKSCMTTRSNLPDLLRAEETAEPSMSFFFLWLYPLGHLVCQTATETRLYLQRGQKKKERKKSHDNKQIHRNTSRLICMAKYLTLFNCANTARKLLQTLLCKKRGPRHEHLVYVSWLFSPCDVHIPAERYYNEKKHMGGLLNVWEIGSERTQRINTQQNEAFRGSG